MDDCFCSTEDTLHADLLCNAASKCRGDGDVRELIASYCTLQVSLYTPFVYAKTIKLLDLT